MIGRELGDPKHIKWMSCANKGMNTESIFVVNKMNNSCDY
jgi:hypothetical protein